MNVTRLLISAAIGALAGGVGALLAIVLFRRPRPTGASSSDPPRKKWSSAQYGVAIAATLVGLALAESTGVTTAIEERIFPESIYANVARRAGRSLLADPMFRASTRGKTEAEVWELARMLTAKGMQRLPFADLRRISEHRRRLAERSPEVCSMMWSGSADPAVLEDAMRSLSRPELEEFFALSMRAATLELHETGEVFVPQDPALTLEAIVAALGRRGAEFRRIVGEGLRASPDDGCAAVRMMFDALPVMTEASARGALAVFLE
jgi:hypothetical protein